MTDDWTCGLDPYRNDGMGVVLMVSVSVTVSVRQNLCHLAETVYDDPFGLYRQYYHEQIQIGLVDGSETVEILE
jgi:hypothetical protein